MKVLVCTAMKIPHIGGASTHIDLLTSVLQQNTTFLGLINGNNIKGSNVERLIYVIKKYLDKDRARLAILMSVVDRMSKQIKSIATMSSGHLVIHSHDPLATYAAVRAAIPNVSIVQTVHGPWSKESLADGSSAESLYNLSIQNIEKEAFACADLLLPVDKGQADILINDFGVECHRIIVIQNAVDVKSLSTSLPIALDEKATPYFIVPRRLVPKNGVEFAIHAFSQLNRKDINLIIAGDGFLKSSLLKLVNDLGVSPNVKFLGDVSYNKVIPLLKRSKAVLVPSVPADGVVEATSLAVLEAMACSVPVIGSAIGGIKDIIRDETCGFLVEAGNPSSIATAMNAVLTMDAMSRSRLTENAKRRIESGFGVKAWQERIFFAYRAAISRTKLTGE